MKIPEAEIRFVGPVNEQYSDRVIYATIEECKEYCTKRSVLGLDIETTRKYRLNTYRNEDVYQPGLDPYLSSVVMLQVGDKKRVYVIDTRSVDISILIPVFQDKSKLFCGANLKFDVKHLLHNYGILFWYIWDVMLVEQNLTNGLGKSKTNPKGLSYSLQAMAGRYLDVAAVQERDLFTEDTEEEDTDQLYIDKRIRQGFLTIKDSPFTESQILYGADDIIYPLYIRDKQLQGFRGYNPVVVHQLENEFCLVLADIELRGMQFDKEQWMRTYEKNLIIYNHRKKKLDDWVVANHRSFCAPPDMFRAEYTCSIQWTSSKQVIELFKHIGFCPMEKSKQTGKMEYTAAAKSLTKLLDGPYKEHYNNDEETEIVEEKDLILNYLLFKVSEQCITTFGKDWLKYIHPITGRVHTSYKQILNTGRMCVDVETLVDTNIGLVRIGDLIPSVENTEKEIHSGIKAKTHTGEYHTITHGINKGKEKLYKVTLESGHTITCTMKHKFFTKNGWNSLKDLVSLNTQIPVYYDTDYSVPTN